MSEISYKFILHFRYDTCKQRLTLMRDMNKLDMFGKAPIHYAARKNSRKIILFLVENGADINIKDSSGVTALHIAAHDKRLDALALLLKHGADPTICDEFGETPYISATIEGFEKAAAILLSAENKKVL